MQLPFLHIHNFISPTAYLCALLALGEDTPDRNHLLTIGTHGLVHHPPDHLWPLLVSLQRRGFSSSVSTDLRRAIIHSKGPLLLATQSPFGNGCARKPLLPRLPTQQQKEWKLVWLPVLTGDKRQEQLLCCQSSKPMETEELCFLPHLAMGRQKTSYLSTCNEKHFPRYARGTVIRKVAGPKGYPGNFTSRVDSTVLMWSSVGPNSQLPCILHTKMGVYLE